MAVPTNVRRPKASSLVVDINGPLKDATMKKIVYAAFAGVVVLFAACTKKEVEAPAENQQPEVVKSTPVYITAGIDPETTKSTLDEAGAFGFTNSDVIKIWDGTTMIESEGVIPDDPDASKATIAFPAGFDEGGTASGWFTAFPASLVSNIEADGVTFTLPASYTYDEVGHEDPDISSVPCPMIGTYTHGEGISYKQAGAVIRIRLTNLAAGSLTFMFSSPVTGTMKLTGVPTEESTTAGLDATNEGWTGKTITVTDTPYVANGNYIFITLPVPSGTAPYEIAVINECNDASGTRMAAIKGNNTQLNRRGGWKLSARPEAISHTFEVAAGRSVVIAPGNLMAKIESYIVSDKHEEDGVMYEYGYATASEWKFGGYFEYIGGTKTSSGASSATLENCTTGNDLLANAGNPNYDFKGALIGKWVDLFTFQGSFPAEGRKWHGLVNRASTSWTGTGSLYSGCWDGLTISNGGGYSWRPMTKDEWEYLLVGRAATGGSTVGGIEHALHGRATVAGVKGLLIFPDGITWRREEDGGSKNCGSDALNAAMNAIAAKNKEEGVGYPKNLNINTVDPDNKQEGDSYDFSISYSAYEFVSMAQSGIVFLPAAGHRGGTQIQHVQNRGRYWSSTGADGTNAYNLSFDKGKVQPVVAEGRTNGRSVRLVRDVTP